mmetsp:Transcript_9065/g.16089  ORF Transcript_9065/g.16089 Transcript_9065/m.16089 type:complete len:242 (-) Transcript_9065:181-906(-)
MCLGLCAPSMLVLRMTSRFSMGCHPQRVVRGSCMAKIVGPMLTSEKMRSMPQKRRWQVRHRFLNMDTGLSHPCAQPPLRTLSSPSTPQNAPARHARGQVLDCRSAELQMEAQAWPISASVRFRVRGGAPTAHAPRRHCPTTANPPAGADPTPTAVHPPQPWGQVTGGHRFGSTSLTMPAAGRPLWTIRREKTDQIALNRSVGDPLQGPGPQWGLLDTWLGYGWGRGWKGLIQAPQPDCSRT